MHSILDYYESYEIKCDFLIIYHALSNVPASRTAIMLYNWLIFSSCAKILKINLKNAACSSTNFIVHVDYLYYLGNTNYVNKANDTIFNVIWCERKI